MTDRRTKVGWTQQALADRLGYDVKYVNEIEQAKKSPSLTTLMSIAAVFDLSVSDLFKAAERRVSPPKKATKQI